MAKIKIKIDADGIVTDEYKRAVQSALKSRGMGYKEFCAMHSPKLKPGSFSSWLTGHTSNRKWEQEYITAISNILGV